MINSADLSSGNHRAMLHACSRFCDAFIDRLLEIIAALDVGYVSPCPLTPAEDVCRNAPVAMIVVVIPVISSRRGIMIQGLCRKDIDGLAQDGHREVNEMLSAAVNTELRRPPAECVVELTRHHHSARRHAGHRIRHPCVLIPRERVMHDAPLAVGNQLVCQLQSRLLKHVGQREMQRSLETDMIGLIVVEHVDQAAMRRDAVRIDKPQELPV